MRILSISLDQTIANPNSSAAERQRQYYREWNTEIIVLESGSEATTELESGIRVHVTGGRNKVVAFLRGWKLACQVADRGLDVVTAQDPLFCGIIGWRAATRARARLIIQDHSGFFARQHFYTVDRLLAPLARRLVRRADRVRTVSARGFRGLVACGVDPRRIDAIPIATNIDRFTDITLPPSAPNVLCIARLEPEKGISILLEAWRTVVSQVTDAKLRIVGDGSKRVALEDIASQMGISGSVEFIGKAEDVRPHIAWAAIAVQPSFFEGWGIAVVEAAAAGRPVVMTDVGCAGEVIRDGETGIVVPVGDVPALAKALVKLLRDSVLARTLGSAASVAAKLLQTPFATVEATRYSFEHAIDVRPIDFCQSNEHYCHPSEGWDPSENRMDSCLRRNDNGELIYAKANSLLVVTQTVDLDDPVLGFFHRWLELLAEKTERLTIICLREGRHTLPKNVLVLSLGKETGPSRLKYVRLFYSYIFRYRRAYDGVLVHMNTEYAVLGGLFWRLMRKRVLLWYVHKSVTRKLRLAVELVHGVLTASKESFRLSSPKVRIIGHGVDTEIFTPTDVQVAPLQELRLLTVGRISESKDVRTLINAVEILRSNGGVVTLDIAGDSATDADKVYLQGLRDFVDNQNLQESVHFLGPVNYSALPALYRSHTIFVHASRTGSVDKTVLEALACGLPVVTSSEAFVEGFAPYVKRFPQGDAEALAETIKLLLNAETVLPNTQAVHFIRERYDLKCLISVIIDSYEKDVLSSQR